MFENEEPDEPDEAEPAEPELAAEAEDRPEVFIGERTSRFGVLREKAPRRADAGIECVPGEHSAAGT